MSSARVATCRRGSRPRFWPASLGSNSATQRNFGGGPRPLLVSVRSGAPISMPGMMDAVLNLGINAATESALCAECGDPAFARDVHRRFLDLYGRIVLKSGDFELHPSEGPASWRTDLAAAAGAPVPDDAVEQLRAAVRAVFESLELASRAALPAAPWHCRQPRHCGHRSGAGVRQFRRSFRRRRPVLAQSADRRGGALWRISRARQGEDVVSGKFTPRPLAALAASLPEAHDTCCRPR